MDNLVLRDTRPSATLGNGASVVEGMPAVDLGSLDHARAHVRAGCAEGCLDFWDVLILRCGTVVAQVAELACSLRD